MASEAAFHRLENNPEEHLEMDDLDNNHSATSTARTSFVKPAKDVQSPIKRSYRKISLKLILPMIVALIFIAIHLGFFLALDGVQIDKSSISQPLSTAIANLLAQGASMALMAGIVVAYQQHIWKIFRRKPLPVHAIDKLITLISSPWNLSRWRIFTAAPLAWVLAWFCILIPSATTFPPGALTVEMRDAQVSRAIPTMVLGDFGDGTLPDLFRKAMFKFDLSLEYTKPKASLTGLSTFVLAKGKPVDFPGPCQGVCSYNLTLTGPSFQCEEVPVVNFTGISQKDMILTSRKNTGKGLSPFPLSVIWRPEINSEIDSDGNHGVADQAVPLKQMNCSSRMATYEVQVDISGNDRTVRSETSSISPVDNSRSDDDGTVLFDNYKKKHPFDKEAVSKSFANMQSWAIEDAAISLFEGSLYYSTGRGWFTMNSSDAQLEGSSFWDARDPGRVRIILSPARFQDYLKNITISTIALNRDNDPTWATPPEKIRNAANTYVFSDKIAFFVPYGMALLATLVIYAVGLQSFRANGVSAGDSFLQIVSTTNLSKSLREQAVQCSRGGDESFSDPLKDMKVLYGLKKRGFEDETEYTGSEQQPVYGFGRPDEVTPIR